MELSLPQFPSETGAQAAYLAAVITSIIGFALLAFPASIARLIGLQSRENRPGAIGELRAAGGFVAGLALAALMFDQQVLYTALGVALAIAAFGRIVSLMSDRAATLVNILLLVVQLVLAGASLYYFFDIFTPESEYAVPEAAMARMVFYTYAALAIIGTLVMLAPRLACRQAGIEATSDSGYASVRSTGGFMLGAALVAMAAATPMMDLGFGGALALAALARLVSLALTRGNYLFAAIALIIEGAAAALIIAYVMGMM